jgi:hypothetical protein
MIRYPDYESFDSFFDYFSKVNEVSLKDHEIQYFIDHPDEAEARKVDIVRMRDEVVKDKTLDENSKRAFIPRLENSLRQLGYYRINLPSQNNNSNSNEYWKTDLVRIGVPAITAAVLAYLLGKEHGKQEALSIREDAKELAKQFSLQSTLPNGLTSQNVNPQQQEDFINKIISIYNEVQNIGNKVEAMEKEKVDERRVEERRKEAKKMIKNYTS